MANFKTISLIEAKQGQWTTASIDLPPEGSA